MTPAKTSPKTGTMTLVLGLLSLALLAGCGKSQDARHVGAWELDKEIVKEAMLAEIAAVEDPAQREVMEMGMAMIGAAMLDAMDMTLTLNADGTAVSTTVIMGETETVRGRWSARGDTVRIEMTGEGQTEGVEVRVDGDVLELLPPEGEDMPFRMVMRRRAQ
jgi:hypothetical protein